MRRKASYALWVVCKAALCKYYFVATIWGHRSIDRYPTRDNRAEKQNKKDANGQELESLFSLVVLGFRLI